MNGTSGTLISVHRDLGSRPTTASQDVVNEPPRILAMNGLKGHRVATNGGVRKTQIISHGGATELSMMFVKEYGAAEACAAVMSKPISHRNTRHFIGIL